MDNSNYSPYQNKRSNSMATAALILGIIGIAIGCCVYTGIICGALAIIFALLSRGGEMTMDSKAKAGVVLGIIAIVISILLLVGALAMLIAQFGSIDNYMDYYYDLYDLYDMDMSSYPYSL